MKRLKRSEHDWGDFENCEANSQRCIVKTGLDASKLWKLSCWLKVETVAAIPLIYYISVEKALYIYFTSQTIRIRNVSFSYAPAAATSFLPLTLFISICSEHISANVD